MFLANARADHWRRLATNVYGEASWGAQAKILCSVVHLMKKAQPTSVRTDSSASRGNADETVSQTKLLVDARETVAIGDKVRLFGFTLVISGLEPRYDIYGALDHYEVDLEQWSGP